MRKNFAILLLLYASTAAMAQQLATPSSSETDVMVVAVSRNQYMFTGGLGPDKWTGRGTVVVEPFGYITQSGDWKPYPCSKNWPKSCPKFAREYLSKPHTYSIVSADGYGATIQAAPTTLSECRDYTGPGTYMGAAIEGSAIASSKADVFSESEQIEQINSGVSVLIRRTISNRIASRIDTTKYQQFFALHMENLDLRAVQGRFADKAIFAIGTMDQGRFHILHWKKNTEDEEERVLGTIRLKSGRDFLITTVNDPESQWFRVYGIRDGKVTLVYEGGGSSC